jgi:hypothetical protein
MSNVIRSPFQPVALEIIAKLIKAGYLHPAAHNSADAITNAISQMKQDLRGRGGRDAGPGALERGSTTLLFPRIEALNRHKKEPRQTSEPGVYLGGSYACPVGEQQCRSHQFLIDGFERRGIGFCCQRQRRCRCLYERSCVGNRNSENDRPLRVALNPSVRLPLSATRA